MSDYQEKTLPITIILNCILVNENVRPAMLVQPADYKERTHSDPRTKSIIEGIKKYFPNFILTSDYENYQGVIVSKIDYEYNGNKNIEAKEMGKILGYPCYEDFTTIDINSISYAIEIYVEVNQVNQNSKIQILANKCKDTTKVPEFNSLASNAKNAFAKKDYSELLNGFEVKEVYVEISQNIPTQTIINKLLTNETLEQAELDKVQNMLYNFGFSNELQFYFMIYFQYNNPIHKGILLELLLKEKHDILSPFYPLQNYPTQSKKVNELIEQWEKGLLIILEKTAIV
jgi:hypothetical protein